MALKQKVISGLAWGTAGKFLTQIITWGVTIVVIRMLSPADYGLMALAGVFVAFLATLSEFGLGSAVVQRKGLDHNDLRSLFAVVLLASAIFFILLAITAPLIASFYQEPRLISLIRVMALEFPLIGLKTLPRSLLLREMKFRQIAIVEFFSAVAGSITTLVLALAGYGVWALVWGFLMIRIVSTVGFNIVHPFLHLPRTNMKGMLGYFSFGGYVTLSTIIWYLYSNADALIVGKILGNSLLGFYSVGLMLANLPMEKVSGIINQVAFPAFSSVQFESGTAGKHFLKAVRVMSFIAFPVLWGISSVAPEIVRVFLGEKWSQASLPLEIIALAIPIRMISNLVSPAVLGKGRPDILFFTSIIGLITMPAAFYGGSLIGLLWVSLVWVFVFPLVFCLNLYCVVKILEVRFCDVLQAMQMPLLAGVIMYLAVFFAKKFLVLGNFFEIFKLLLLVCCGAIVYLIMSLFINRRGFVEIKEILKV